jgi:uncharacterized protein YbcC (UPF0753/DUF2309 family)
LEKVIEQATHFLPAQGPINVFIHHNTLHAFEDLPFDSAVQLGARIFGCQPYLSEDQYREYLARGRIQNDDLAAALLEDLGDSADVLLGFLGTRYHLRLAMLAHPLRTAPTAELRWFVAETDALAKFRTDTPAAVRDRFIEETRHWVMRDLLTGELMPTGTSPDSQKRSTHAALARLIQRFGASSIERWSAATWEAFTLQALWRACRDGAHRLGPAAAQEHSAVRHRDVLLEATREDSDVLVHEVLIRFCAAFLDQGFAQWPLPCREQGFYRAFSALYRQGKGLAQPWLRTLSQELNRLAELQREPLDSILESLQLLGVPQAQWEEFITASLLALRGWAGMIHQLEVRGDRVARPAPPGSLVEFLAVRLLLDRLAIAHVARETLDYEGPLDRSRLAARADTPRQDTSSVNQRAFLVFQLAQVLGWLPADLYRLSKQEWSMLVEEIEAFSALDRRRVFHHAFERHYRIQTLDAVAIRARQPARRRPPPRFQTISCIDEREESFRRHLEEISPDAETFSVAGFYSVAMYYRGAGDAHFIPLCPVVIRPQHWVVEDVVYVLDEIHRRRAKARWALGAASHEVHVRSRSFTGGALLAAGVGALATIPLVARVLFPRLTARIRKRFERLVQPPPLTRLQIERQKSTPGPHEGQFGFTVEEMADIVERVLRDIGLTRNFARLVVALGHGSVSLNNPHESAHDCGACGGAVGGPNARAWAEMANDPRVRQLLSARCLEVPAETVFVGALHNTCDDSLTLFDLDRLPKDHHAEFSEVQHQLEQACDRNAHERCRRFESAPLSLSFSAARRHVEGRSQDLAETRPEYGHASNAVCIVGRRSRNRGLFLDRRTFLMSYDPTQDDAKHSILTGVLQAVVPVCAGISLEYYFSFVDPTGWGCGTKLPHNITSLLGVMDGAASDLRAGLPWQMVEIHEPVRLLFIIEATPQTLLEIMERQESIGRLCRNDWVQLATLDPESSEIHLFRRGRFELYHPHASALPKVRSSAEWYRGWRQHLGYAQIES